MRPGKRIQSSTGDRNIGQSIDNFFGNALQVGYLIAPLIIVFFIWRACKRIDKQYVAKCTLEKTLQFGGVVSEYSTDIFAEKSTFLLNDSLRITIPRNFKEVCLRDGDTVTKVKGQNIYKVRWKDGWNGMKHEKERTYAFECAVD